MDNSTESLLKLASADDQPKKSDVETDDISLSQLELMANKKKLNKKSSHVSVSEIVSKKSDKQASDQVNSMDLKVSVPKSEPKARTKRETTKSSSSSSSSSRSESTTVAKRKQKKVTKENKDDNIRKQKIELLYKFNKLNVKGKWSSLKLDMNNSFDEIRNEYERIKNEMQTDRSVGFFKRMLLLGVQGVEMLNTKFDPMGVDLEGWSESMGYSMENQEYDEVLAELYEKYKGRGHMSPELKLIFMIISSGVMFSISKKITKLDASSLLKTFLGQQSQQPQAQQQQSQVQQPQQPQQHPGLFGNLVIPNATSLRRHEQTDTTEDNMPSRIHGPNTDSQEIDKILRTMNERQREKDRQRSDTNGYGVTDRQRSETRVMDNVDELENILQNEIENASEDILKNIPLKRRVGRPKKNQAAVNKL